MILQSGIYIYIYYIWKLGFTLKFTFSEDSSHADVLNLVRERTRAGEYRDILSASSHVPRYVPISPPAIKLVD